MLGNLSMIERVYRQAKQATRLAEVVVATDDTRILDHVIGFGGKAVITSADHRTGTERCAEAARKLENACDAVINIQGDEPFISPLQIDAVADAMEQKAVRIATLYRKAGQGAGHGSVKVVVTLNGEAMYFSRADIPYSAVPGQGQCLHVGIYGYCAEVLQEISALPPGKLEVIESLEQLRWLENGYTVHAFETTEVSHPVDTPSDLEKVKSTFRL